MESRIWNNICISSSEAAQASLLLIAFNFPLKLCLFLNKRLIEEGSVCRVIYTRVLPPFHSEVRCTHVPTPEMFEFSSSRKIAADHQSLQLN